MHFLHLLLAALFVVSVACQSSTMTAAKLYLKQEEPLKAKEQLLLTIEAEPENAEAHFLLGKLYGAKGHMRKWSLSLRRYRAVPFQAEIDVLRQNYWARDHIMKASHLPKVIQWI